MRPYILHRNYFTSQLNAYNYVCLSEKKETLKRAFPWNEASLYVWLTGHSWTDLLSASSMGMFACSTKLAKQNLYRLRPREDKNMFRHHRYSVNDSRLFFQSLFPPKLIYEGKNWRWISDLYRPRFMSRTADSNLDHYEIWHKVKNRTEKIEHKKNRLGTHDTGNGLQ